MFWLIVGLVTLVCTLISAFLYRLGGMSKAEAKTYWIWRWVPDWMIDTKARDIGCALITLFWMIAFFKFPVNIDLWKIIVSHTVCFLGTFGALTTYWDSLFGYDNFYAHGFMIGLAKIMYAIFTGCWIPFILYCILLGITMGLLSNKVDWSKFGIRDDYGDECSRGGIMQLLLLLFRL